MAATRGDGDGDAVLLALPPLLGTRQVLMLLATALARAQGYRLEPVAARQTGDVVSPAQRLMRAAAELSAQLLDALEDHTISPAERDGLLATAGLARQAADAVMASLHPLQDQG